MFCENSEEIQRRSRILILICWVSLTIEDPKSKLAVVYLTITVEIEVLVSSIELSAMEVITQLSCYFFQLRLIDLSRFVGIIFLKDIFYLSTLIFLNHLNDIVGYNIDIRLIIIVLFLDNKVEQLLIYLTLECFMDKNISDWSFGKLSQKCSFFIKLLLRNFRRDEDQYRVIVDTISHEFDFWDFNLGIAEVCNR